MRIRYDARSRYSFDESLFSESGHLVLGGIRSAHIFANIFNRGKKEELQISPAEANAAAIIHDMLHHAISDFVKRRAPNMIGAILDDANEDVGQSEVDRTMVEFVSRFPTEGVARADISPSEYLSSTSGGSSNRVVTLEEMLICWLSNENPAYEPFDELIHDEDIRSTSSYDKVVARFNLPTLTDSSGAPAGPTLLDILREPVRRSPNSLRDQLAFMASGEWDLVDLPTSLVNRAIIAGDLIAEEARAMAARHFTPGPPPPPPVPDYADEPEYEAFSPDVDWMPRVVMLAKNAFVWLHQLSVKYDRTITRLDDIPDEEIEQLAGWGFTALWLIGVWQRSTASRELKRRTGNPEAEASAYSLYDYVIADELGGPAALTGFRMMCQRHGVRLSADMVPNHTGIDARWVFEHPDWFVQLPYPPYPSYSYNSESLSDDPSLIIQVEDGYYSRSDAAVTFRRYDSRTGDERFIYHGNDGTSMPWNDTAQLDFTRSEVREAVIQTILHVARQFPIIRFDAAMVLTRKHFRRLWYPAPGSGGGVPSRAEQGLSQAEFDQRMPLEFWREVVDRVAAEVPDTLLLAEAFWLLEGYFVRTLGMHRVYNSAFMHMLKDEDNAKYRSVIKNTLSFEPEVLKRYVNFMSNPDEETAIEQFGDGDKFFGVAALLMTMPGLPMVAHGQVEGFSEKYGMEYRRAYHDEEIRQDLVDRFEQQIVPLMRKRYLFADVSNFYLFDFASEHGDTVEDVFAYSNRFRDERALVVYNNRFERAVGRIVHSTHLESGSPPATLGAALRLDQSTGTMVTFRDLTSNQEHVVSARQFFNAGLSFSLNGYECHVFTEFQIIPDDEDGTLAELAAKLDGRGVESLEEARLDVRFKPLEELLTHKLDALLDDPGAIAEHESREAVDEPRLRDLVAESLGIDRSRLDAAFDRLGKSIAAVGRLVEVGKRYSWPRSKRYSDAVAEIERAMTPPSEIYSILVVMSTVSFLMSVTDRCVRRLLSRTILNVGLATDRTVAGVESVACALSLVDNPKDAPLLSLLLDETHFATPFLINEFAGTKYYNKERFELGLIAAFCTDVMRIEEQPDQSRPEKEVARSIADLFDALQRLRAAHDTSDYEWNKLVGPSTRGRRGARSRRKSNRTKN